MLLHAILITYFALFQSCESYPYGAAAFPASNPDAASCPASNPAAAFPAPNPAAAQSCFEYPSNTKSEDIEMIREMLPDEEGCDADPLLESPESLNQAINAEFAMIVSNLALEKAIYFDAKMDAIKRAMEFAFLKTTGTIDRTYVDGVLSMIRSEVDAKRKSNQQLAFSNPQINKRPFGTY